MEDVDIEVLDSWLDLLVEGSLKLNCNGGRGTDAYKLKDLIFSENTKKKKKESVHFI